MWYDSRQMKRCTSDEIANALRGELEGGRYRAGECLPPVDELRRRFGAGEFAVRAALKKLRDDGCITLKQGIGAVVTGKADNPWKGRVVFVSVGARGSYFPSMLSICLARRLMEHGWDCATVFIDSAPDGELDVSPLERQIANGVDFAVGLLYERQVTDLFERAGVPYVVLNGYTRDFPNAAGVVREDFSAAFMALIAAFKSAHARSVIEFDCERKMDRAFKAMLSEAGIAVRRVLGSWDNSRTWTLYDVAAFGHKVVGDFFADERNREKLPDAILFDDDYFAVGGLVALMEAGLRVPDDVKVVFYSNKGKEPVLGVSAARIENDPISYGKTVADYVLKLLSGRKAKPPTIHWRFIPGDSL